MNKEQQDTILRMKLLMGYDTKKTLSENYEKVKNKNLLLEENQQGMGKYLPPPSIVQNLDAYLVIWLNANPNLIGPGKPYNDLWNAFVKKVTNSTITELQNVRNTALNGAFSVKDKNGKTTNYTSNGLGVDGGITPDLPGYNRAAYTGAATAVIDGQIYASRMNNYRKLKNKYDSASPNELYNKQTNPQGLKDPQQPQAPSWTLLDKVNIRTGPALAEFVNTKTLLQSLGAYGKSASQVEGEKKDKETKGKCYFNDANSGNDFRLYVNAVYPELAQKKKKDGGLELASRGEFCNDYINQAYDFKIAAEGNKTLGQLYNEFKSWEKNKKANDPNYIKYDTALPSDYTGTGGSMQKNMNLSPEELERAVEIEKAKGLKYTEDAQKNDCKFSNPNEGDLFRVFVAAAYPQAASLLDLELTGDWCNNTIKKAYDYAVESASGANKTLGELYNGFKYFKENQKMLDDFSIDITTSQDATNTKYTLSQEQIDKVVKANQNAQKIKEYEDKEFYNNKDMWAIFGKEKLLKAKEECPYRLSEFLEKIKSGEIYDEKTGLAYGSPALNADGSGGVVRWPKDKEIPCESEFWDEWGNTIQWGGMILSMALSIPSLGTSLTFGAALGTRLFLAAAIDMGVNFTSAYHNYKAGREEDAQMDIVIGLLSAGMEIPGISKVLTKNFDDWGEQEVIKLFKDRSPKDYNEFKDWLKTLSKDQQNVMANVLDNKEVLDEVRKFAESANSPIKRVTDAMEKTINKSTGIGSGKRLLKTIWENVKFKVPIILLPVAYNMAPTLYYTIYKGLEPIIGKNPNNELVKKFHEELQKQYPNVDENELAKQLLENNGEAFKEVAIQVLQAQGKLPTEEDLNKLNSKLSEIQSEIDSLLKQAEASKSKSTETVQYDSEYVADFGNLSAEEVPAAVEEFKDSTRKEGEPEIGDEKN